MTIKATQKIVSELREYSPLTRMAIEVEDNGFYWVFGWTGWEVVVATGPTLPIALMAFSQVLANRFGSEV